MVKINKYEVKRTSPPSGNPMYKENIVFQIQLTHYDLNIFSLYFCIRSSTLNKEFTQCFMFLVCTKTYCLNAGCFTDAEI